MPSRSSEHCRRQAGLYLHELLLKHHWAQWEEHAQRRRLERVNVSGATAVVENYLKNHPQADTAPDGRRRRFNRGMLDDAFAGKGLSRDALELTSAAFDISPDRANVLRKIWHGELPSRVVVGELRTIADSPQNCTTVQRHDYHYVGADGQPTHHRTDQVVQSHVDGYDMHQHRYVTHAATVECIHGGELREPYQLDDTTWAVDITLPAILNRGDQLSMAFVTRFHEAQASFFCYATHERAENILIRVEFHPQMEPKSVWWTEWREYREPNMDIAHQEIVTLNSEHAVERRLDVLDGAAVGFVWDFASHAISLA